MVGKDATLATQKPNPSLLKALGRAHRFHDMLVNQKTRRFAELAQSEEAKPILLQPNSAPRLAYLAPCPDIIAAILDGRQPEPLTATVLIEYPRLPLSWHAQRAELGFA